MEFLIVMGTILSIIAVWFFCGWAVVSSSNFLSLYLSGGKFFDSEDYPEILPIGMGPLMFLFILYPVWLLIKYLGSLIYENIGRTVVVEDIREYTSNYRNSCLNKSSTKSLSNFFNAYMEKETSKFYHTDTGDANALENFFRIDGWRNVGEGVWTKIVKVKDLNTGDYS